MYNVQYQDDEHKESDHQDVDNTAPGGRDHEGKHKSMQYET